MKKILLLPFLIFATLNLIAQTTYKYNFNNNLHDLDGVGPDLVASCTAAYNIESLPIGISKYCFQFNKGCGLTFDDAAGFLATGTYTIEMYVKLDTVQGYKKIVDYDGRSSDNGFYNQTGKLVLYPNFNSDSLVGGGQYFYIALTRDASTKSVSIYVNHATAGKYSDTGNIYVYDSHKTLTFFIDDSVTNHEDVTGAVAMLHISNYAMDSTTINNNYTALAATLNLPNTTTQANELSIYPNPAADNVHIRTAAACSYIVSDITGRAILNGNFVSGDNKLDLNNITAGIYLLRVTDKVGVESRAYKLIKE